MQTRDNYYTFLGLQPNATPQEIKENYERRKSSYQSYADQTVEPTLKGDYASEAADKMNYFNQSLLHQLEEAYQVLSDPAEKEKYDAEMFPSEEEMVRKKKEKVTAWIQDLNRKSKKAFFEEKQSSPIPPEFIFVCINSRNMKNAKQFFSPYLLANLLSCMQKSHADNLLKHIEYIIACEAKLIDNDRRLVREGVFTSDTAATEFLRQVYPSNAHMNKDGLIVKMKFKDPSQFDPEQITVTAADIESFYSVNKGLVDPATRNAAVMGKR